jgi:DNA-directed RNA polymerase specialized sigma24 family protein
LIAVRRGMSASPDDRFAQAFEAHHRLLFAFALRRVATAADAEDAVAETFAVAWRRRDQLPDPDETRPWLLAIARRVVANQRRSFARRLRLGVRLRSEPRPSPIVHGQGGPAIDALGRLRPDDRELLQLLAWEALTQAEAAVVLGITPNAVAIRLHRARRRFADELARTGVKGSGPSRTSDRVEGRTHGHRTGEEPAP